MKTRMLLTICLILCAGSLAAGNVFGTFQVLTEPAGARVSLMGSNRFLGITPTPVHPIEMGRDVVWYGGIPGRVLNVMITLDGYLPITQTIFVPFSQRDHREARRNPTVFKFHMQRAQHHQYGYRHHVYPWHPHPQPPAYYYLLDPEPSPSPHMRSKPRRRGH